MKPSNNRNRALLSLLCLFLGLTLHNLGLFGLAPIFVTVISLFTTLIYGSLYLTGRRSSDPFDTYQEGAKTKAIALEAGLKPNNSKENSQSEINP